MSELTHTVMLLDQANETIEQLRAQLQAQTDRADTYEKHAQNCKDQYALQLHEHTVKVTDLTAKLADSEEEKKILVSRHAAQRVSILQQLSASEQRVKDLKDAEKSTAFRHYDTISEIQQTARDIVKESEQRVRELEALIGTIRGLLNIVHARNVQDISCEQHSREIVGQVQHRFTEAQETIAWHDKRDIAQQEECDQLRATIARLESELKVIHDIYAQHWEDAIGDEARNPVGKVKWYRAKCALLQQQRDQLQATVTAQTNRQRANAQALIELVGANGPMSIEEAIERTGKHITAQAEEIGRLRGIIQWALGEHPTEDFPSRGIADGLYWWRSKLRLLYAKALASEKDAV